MFKLSQQQTYFIVFTILALWAGFAYYTMHTLIDGQKYYGKLINISGKQRMLSQRTALFAGRYIKEHKAEQLTHLRDLHRLMQEDHTFIISHMTSKTIETIYFGQNSLDPKVQSYLNLLESFIQEPSASGLTEILTASNALLPELNAAVYAFERESAEMVQNLKNREMFIFIGTIFTLILEALLFVRPMIRLQEHYTDALEQEVLRKTHKNRIYTKIFENSLEGVIITDAQERILEVNDAFVKMTGYSRSELINKTPRILQSGKYSKEFYVNMWQQVEQHGIWKSEIINKAKDDRIYHEYVTVMKLYDDLTDEVNYVGIYIDITPLKENEERYKHIAMHDNLTGLANRILLIDRLSHAMHFTLRLNRKMAVIFIDLNDFKNVNDTYGHDIGDHYLTEIAKRLTDSVRNVDTVARIGGDEFVILIESLNSTEDIMPLVSKIDTALTQTMQIGPHIFTPTASFGVVLYPDHADIHEDALTLIKKADTAMYEAKKKGSAENIVLYPPRLA